MWPKSSDSKLLGLFYWGGRNLDLEKSRVNFVLEKVKEYSVGLIFIHQFVSEFCYMLCSEDGERWRTWFLLSGSSESTGKVMESKRSTTEENSVNSGCRELWRMGERSRKLLKGDNLKAESCGSWLGNGWWWRINQAEGAVVQRPAGGRGCVFLGNCWQRKSGKQGALKAMKGLDEFLAGMWHRRMFIFRQSFYFLGESGGERLRLKPGSPMWGL